MIGILLAAGSGLFVELSTAIGKYEFVKKKESLYLMGFFSNIWAFVFFGILILVQNRFQFSLASLPTFTLRAGLEILEVYVILKGVMLSSRTTNTLFRTLTIPLLLATDLFFGYAMTQAQVIGMVVIMLCLSILALNHGIEKKGLIYVFLSAINAVSTISLYKYNITHFNSVEAEQFLILGVLLIWLSLCIRMRTKEHPLRLMKQPVFALQSASYGIATLLGSFAYIFAPASVILSSFRSSQAIGSLLTGKIVFHEDHVLLKTFAIVGCVFGIVLLTM